MFASLSPRWRRLINSLSYGALVAIVAGLGYLTFRGVSERRHAGEEPAAANPDSTMPLLEISNFSTRREKSAETERLTVSLRIRLTTGGSVASYIYVVARNDHVSPKLWGVWPPQAAGDAITAGGHFRGSSPASGELMQLTSGWTRITAPIDHPIGRPAFDTATVYVVSPKGAILISRPFSL